jgi:hypothetical protein
MWPLILNDGVVGLVSVTTTAVFPCSDAGACGEQCGEGRQAGDSGPNGRICSGV